MKLIPLLFILFYASLPSKAQTILEDLRSRPGTIYLKAYGSRFVKDSTSGFYFLIDDGKTDISSTIDTLYSGGAVTHLAHYLKNRKGERVDFTSTVEFLSIMHLYGWDLVCDPSATESKKDKINVFLLKRREP